VSTASGDLDAQADAVDAQREANGRYRRLQLGLAALWLLDAMLQGQSFMFSRGFARMLAAAARDSPAAVADPANWCARLIGEHPVAANSAFIAVQLLLALGIAWRPTVKIALAASVPWSLAVWWLGEGLGGVLAAGANPATGAPSAVLLYALLAVVLWPSDRHRDAPFPAARAVGVPTARAGWLALWGGLAWLAAWSVSQGPRTLSETISAQAAGQPRWLAAADSAAASLVARHGILVTTTLAALLVIIACGVFLPPAGARAALAAAVVVALVSWVVGQNFGGIFTGTGTDPNSGPLLVLLAAAYWPSPASAACDQTPDSGAASGPAPDPGVNAARLARTGPRRASHPAAAAAMTRGGAR